MATLTLLRDGDRGNPLGSAQMDSIDDLGDALGEIEEQAQAFLEAEQESLKDRNEALRVPAEEEAAPKAVASGAKTASK